MKVEPNPNLMGVLIRIGRDTRGTHICEHSEETAVYKSRREAAAKTRPANTLILDFQPPKL